MTNVEMAEALDVSEATISRIASGERRPSLDLMIEIRRVLRWSIEDQAEEIRCETYATEFKRRMERRKLRARS